jgi:peptidoglycan/LPS O-acetylase OafA/YrhL
MRYRPELDGLRAVAVLLVVTCHVHDRIWDWLNGQAGVTLFFVLSGYLITTLALEETARTGSVDLRAFYIRRIFRIFPLYYLVLAIYCAIILGGASPSHPPEIFRRALPYYLFYFQEYPFHVELSGSGPGAPFYQSWSLGIEEKFYLVWPMIFVLLPAARLSATLVLLVLFGFGPWLMQASYPSAAAMLFPYFHLLIGCAVAQLLYRKIDVAKGVWLAMPILIALHFIRFPSSIPHDMVYSAAAAVVLAFLVTRDGHIRRTLAFKPLVFVGTLSYGIYLVQILCINVVDHFISPGGSIPQALLSYGLACVLSIAVAYGLHVVLERPFILVGKRVALWGHAALLQQS